MQQVKGCLKSVVSTHSRLKAAGSNNAKILITTKRFNTQPPEGGWREKLQKWVICIVSTHSRLKAAGCNIKFGHLLV